MLNLDELIQDPSTAFFIAGFLLSMCTMHYVRFIASDDKDMSSFDGALQGMAFIAGVYLIGRGYILTQEAQAERMAEIITQTIDQDPS